MKIFFLNLKIRLLFLRVCKIEKKLYLNDHWCLKSHSRGRKSEKHWKLDNWIHILNLVYVNVGSKVERGCEVARGVQIDGQIWNLPGARYQFAF